VRDVFRLNRLYVFLDKTRLRKILAERFGGIMVAVYA
jgi:hypothetical protein